MARSWFRFLSRAVVLMLAFSAWRPQVTAASETGDLRIVSQPDVEVIWEGVVLGSTDGAGVIEISDIPLGAYQVLLRKPDHETRSIAIEVRPGKATLSLHLTSRSSAPPEPRGVPQTKTTTKAPARSPPATLPKEVAPEPSPTSHPDSRSATPQPAAPVIRAEALPKGETEESTATAPRAPRWRPGMVFLLVVVAALSLLVIQRLRRSPPPPRVSAPPRDGRPPMPHGPRAAGSDGLRALREELRRREGALGKSPAKPAGGKPIVIDVDDFQVVERDH